MLNCKKNYKFKLKLIIKKNFLIIEKFQISINSIQYMKINF